MSFLEKWAPNPRPTLWESSAFLAYAAGLIQRPTVAQEAALGSTARQKTKAHKGFRLAKQNRAILVESPQSDRNGFSLLFFSVPLSWSLASSSGLG